MRGNYSPLILLAKDSSIESNIISKLLIKFGANTNLINHKGMSALSFFVENKN